MKAVTSMVISKKTSLRQIGFAAFTAAVLASSANAQFNGPAPVAWRWVQPITNVPTGLPVIEKNLIYVANGNYVFCLDKATGNQIWRFPQGVPNGSKFRYSPVIIGENLALQAEGKNIFVVNKATGELRWATSSSEILLGQPIGIGKYFVANAKNEGLLVIDSSSLRDPGTNIIPMPGGIRGPMRSFGDSAIFFNESGELKSFNVGTKRDNWSLRFGFVDQNSEPVIYGDTVYVNSGTYITAVSATTGNGIWQNNVNEHLRFSPAIGSKGIATVSDLGKIFFFSHNGSSVGRQFLDIGVPPVAQPTAVGVNYLIPSGNGSINLVDPQQGNLLWNYVVPPLSPDALDSKGRPIIGIAAAGGGVSSSTSLLLRLVDGSLICFDKDQGVDLTPPRIKMLWPSPGQEVSGRAPLGLYFSIVDDGSGLNPSTVSVQLDGKPINYRFTKDGVITILVTKSSTLKELSSGRHTFTIGGADWLGNLGSEKFSILVNNALQPLGLAPASSLPSTVGANGRATGSAAAGNNSGAPPTGPGGLSD